MHRLGGVGDSSRQRRLCDKCRLGLRRQISGAPMASMMCVENPETSKEIICVAPAEGESIS